MKGVKSGTVRILELNLFLQSIRDRSGKEQWEGHLSVSAHWLQSGGAALRKVSLEDNCTKPDIAIRFTQTCISYIVTPFGKVGRWKFSKSPLNRGEGSKTRWVENFCNYT